MTVGLLELLALVDGYYRREVPLSVVRAAMERASVDDLQSLHDLAHLDAADRGVTLECHHDGE